MVIQGKDITCKDMELIRQLIDTNPSWGRTRLSREICILWNWRAASGRLKDMVCRSLLLKLDKQKLVTIPAPKMNANNDKRNASIAYCLHSTLPILAKLKTLLPLKARLVEAKYGHPVYMLETFVECGRFLGTCYKASNWIYVGKTKGRSRNDRYATLKVPIKDVYLYPLVKRFREVLALEA